MIIQTSTAKFLIEKNNSKNGCISIHCNSLEELYRFFGSLEISETNDFTYAYMVRACKQEFANALILMVKEIDYTEFAEFSLQTA